MENLLNKALYEETVRINQIIKYAFPAPSILKQMIQRAELLRQVLPDQEIIRRSEYLKDLLSEPAIDFIRRFEHIKEFAIPSYIPISEIIALQNTIDIEKWIDETKLDEEIEDEIEIEAITQESIIIKLDEYRRIKVLQRINDGSWTYTDESSQLPSDIYSTYSSKWKTILKELEEIINSAHTAEEDLQHFLEQYPELLKDDGYNLVIPQACIVPDERVREKPWQADFVLAPIDQTNFCKVLELKRPQASLLRSKRSGHQKYHLRLWEAIQQLKEYGEAFNQTGTRERFYQKYHIDVFKPDLHLIIGRRWGSSSIKEMLFLQKDKQVKIDDWDTYIEQLKRKFS